MEADEAYLVCPANATPRADDTPLAKPIEQHVEPVVTVTVLGRAGAATADRHPVNRRMQTQAAAKYGLAVPDSDAGHSRPPAIPHRVSPSEAYQRRAEMMPFNPSPDWYEKYW
jgi:hypothetical protein